MKVSPLSAALIENAMVKLELLRVQVGPLVKERDRLIDEARKDTNAPDGWLYDTDKCKFVEPK